MNSRLSRWPQAGLKSPPVRSQSSRIPRRSFHSSPAQHVFIKPIPMREDNYGYLIIDRRHSSKGVLVDPYDFRRCQRFAHEAGVTEIVANITTHGHEDHDGGNPDFATAFPSAPIYGGSEDVSNVTQLVRHGDEFPLFAGSSVRIQTYHTPCHTRDSTAFYLQDDESSTHDPAKNEYRRAVFSGDTLFVAGCGRFFEGTAQDMHRALNTVFASLPGDTVVMCGHEYTRSNLAFSLAVLPDRPAIKSLVEFVRQRKNGGVTTGVFSIDDEKKHNVYMMVDDPEVRRAMGMTERNASVDVMAALREAKNNGTMTVQI